MFFHTKIHTTHNAKAMHTQEEINALIQKIRAWAKGLPIVGEFRGYIILAQNENDYHVKAAKISRGDTRGFYTVERIKSILPNSQ